MSTADHPWRCRAEIDLAAIRHNARAAQASVPGGGPAVMAVVKADAYGHGAVAVARTLAPLVHSLAVANVAEAAELRAGGVSVPVYLLSPVLPHERAAVIAGGFCAAVSSAAEAQAWAAQAAEQGNAARLHVVVDTGMGRIGTLPPEAVATVAAVLADPRLVLDSVGSHFASADSDPDFTRRQEADFQGILTDLRQHGLTVPLTQIANSAGLTAYPRGAGELVRAGLMLYGVAPIPDYQPVLRPVLTWKARVAQVRTLPAGHGVSYGSTWVTPHAMRVATLTAGYADGYPRQLSGNGADVLVHGRRCPVLGRVTMDQIIVGVDHLTDPPVPGTEAILLGSADGETISASELAAKAGTIPWDIFTGIGRRVERHWMEGNTET